LEIGGHECRGEEIGELEREQVLVGAAQTGWSIDAERAVAAGELEQLRGVPVRGIDGRVLAQKEDVQLADGRVGLREDVEMATALAPNRDGSHPRPRASIQAV